MHFFSLVCCGLFFGHTAPLLAINYAFVTDYYNDESSPQHVYRIDLDDLSAPATVAVTNIPNPDCIAISPDGRTAYVVSNADAMFSVGNVYTFPVEGPFPYTATALFTSAGDQENLLFATGIAISSDGATGFVANDDVSPNIYSFPLAGPYELTALTPTNATIANPLLLAISGSTMFIADYYHGAVYSCAVNSSSYDVSGPVQTLSDVSGLAVSSDGWLYFSTQDNGDVYRVLIATPSATAVQVTNSASANGASGYGDGLAVSVDGSTLYMTTIQSDAGNGVYMCPTNPTGFPYVPTYLSDLGLTSGAIAMAIPASINAPSGITGAQRTNDFGLLYELFNVVSWGASPSTGVAGYRVYCNGTLVATVGASVLSYADQNVKRSASNTYSVTAFNSGGNESSAVSVTIK